VRNAAVTGGTGFLATAIDAPSRSSSGDRIEIDAARASSSRPARNSEK
jgi:hypothetical protein